MKDNSKMALKLSLWVRWL